MENVYYISMELTGRKRLFCFSGYKRVGVLFLAFSCQYNSRGTSILHTPGEGKLKTSLSSWCSVLQALPSAFIEVVFCETGFGDNWACIREDGGNLELKLEVQHFSLSYSRNSENYLLLYITFEIPSIAWSLKTLILIPASLKVLCY